MIITVLGAGAMGSALATPLRTAGREVRLWGTWLDDEVLDACRAGVPHPRTGVRLADGTALFSADGLAGALDGADVVVLAVASVGFEAVLDRALPLLPPGAPLAITTKGFVGNEHAPSALLPGALRTMADRAGRKAPTVVAVAGPCKANEVAAGRPTAAVFASADQSVGARLAAVFATSAYRAQVSEDESGVEVCAALKNVYAIALGIADGLATEGAPWHDLRAAIFTQAVTELLAWTEAVGGRKVTAVGLAGVGDLEVTGLSGRNKVFGERMGRGEMPSTALAAMQAAQQTVEGVPAARLANRLGSRADTARLPLFGVLLDLLDRDLTPASSETAMAAILSAVMPQ